MTLQLHVYKLYCTMNMTFSYKNSIFSEVSFFKNQFLTVYQLSRSQREIWWDGKITTVVCLELIQAIFVLYSTEGTEKLSKIIYICQQFLKNKCIFWNH